MAGDLPGNRAEPRLGAGLWATVRLLPAVSRASTAALAAAVLVAAALPVAFIVASGHLVGAVPAAVEGGFSSPAGRRLLWLLVVTSGVFVANQVVDQVVEIVADRLGRRLNGVLRERVMAATLGPTGIAHLEDPARLDTISLARNVAPGMYQPGGAVYGLAAGAAPRLAVLGSAAIVAGFSPLLAGALLVAAVAFFVLITRVFFSTVKVVAGRHADLRRSVYFRDLALTPAAAKESRVFGLRGWIGQRFTDAWLTAMRVAWAERRQGRWGLVVAVVGYGLAEAGALIMVGGAGARGEIDLAQLAVLVGAIGGTLALTISDLDLRVAYGAAAVPAILALDQAPGDPPPGLPPAGRAARPASASGRPAEAIRLEGVGFAYPGADRRVYDSLDLEIPAGQRLAVVGANGAGKTTLVKLLACLYQPTAGRITVDGLDVAGLDPAAWRRQVAVLFQDFVHYELPLSDNVAFGDLDAGGQPGTLDRALRRAGGAGLLADLPAGWDTVLSRGVPGGAELSGGQWQRVALARALLAVDGGARLLILDEPTANLDVRAEAEIYDRFLELTAAPSAAAPLTTIVVSHRFSTVRRADRIVVLEEGRVIEDGDHAQLLAAGGRYAAMFTAQASRFTEVAGA